MLETFFDRGTPVLRVEPRVAARRLLGAATTAGLVLTLVALPVVGGGGLATMRAVDYWNALPSELGEPPLPQGSVLLARDGKTRLATLFEYDRQPVTIAQVAPVMRTAIVAIEDSRFYTNSGVDARGTLRAAVSTGTGSQLQGGSSITQQYVKNALLLEASSSEEQRRAAGLSIDRKLREAKYALSLGAEHTKDEILERYLNIAYFGAGAYGIGAASRRYFSIAPADLTLPQAALLAGLVQNPTAYDPTVAPEAARERRTHVLRRMAELGVISPAQRAAADATPVRLRETVRRGGCQTSSVPFYCDWVVGELLRSPQLGRTEQQRRQRILEGGLRIVTTLDPRAQENAEAAVAATIPSDHRVAAVDVVVQPGTGHVLAMAVNRDYGTGKGETVYPLATSPAYQAGSTFKAFTLAAALEAGLPLSTRLPGGDRYTSEVFDNPEDGYYANADDGHGTDLTLRQATAESVNTAFVQLMERVGSRAVGDVARRAGVTTLPASGKGAVHRREGSLTLGSRTVSPLDLASSFATFAAHGRACQPVAVSSIRDRAGKAVTAPARSCRQAFTPAVADTVTSVLASVLEPGGTGASASLEQRRAAGKTGTTDNEGSAWFVGYTGEAAAAVVMSDPRGAARYPLHDVLGVAHVYGGTLPAQIWKDTLDAVLEGRPASDLPGPDAAYLLPGGGPLLPAVSGMPVAAARESLAGLGVKVQVRQVPRNRLAAGVPAGAVVGSEPAAGTPVREGGTVVLEVAR